VARAEVICERMNSMCSTAHDNICAAEETHKRHYDVKRRPPTFTIGDRVYRYNRRHDTRKGGKLATRYDGPFVIAEVLGKKDDLRHLDNSMKRMLEYLILIGVNKNEDLVKAANYRRPAAVKTRKNVLKPRQADSGGDAAMDVDSHPGTFGENR